jgi:hypothetical protein
VIHVALDLSNLTLTDTEQRYIAIDTGSLVGTYRHGKMNLFATIGTRRISIDNSRAIISSGKSTSNLRANGFLYSGGIRYDASSWAHITLTTGQDVLVSPFRGASDYSHFLRLDLELNLI